MSSKNLQDTRWQVTSEYLDTVRMVQILCRVNTPESSEVLLVDLLVRFRSVLAIRAGPFDFLSISGTSSSSLGSSSWRFRLVESTHIPADGSIPCSPRSRFSKKASSGKKRILLTNDQRQRLAEKGGHWAEGAGRNQFLFSRPTRSFVGIGNSSLRGGRTPTFRNQKAVLPRRRMSSICYCNLPRRIQSRVTTG